MIKDRMMSTRTLKSIAGLIFCLCFNNAANGQLQSMAAQFQNQYAANPAYAGINEGLFLNIDYRNQWVSVPGSPVTSTLTGDYRVNGNVGVGLKLTSDVAGLITRNSLVGSYAYHLPLTRDGERMHFGLSLGLLKDQFNNNDIIGDPDDVTAGEFNTRKVFIDGDFGVGYTYNRFSIQGAIPNLKVYLKKDQTNSVRFSTMMFAMSYKIGRDLDQVSIEPKVSYLGASGVEDIWNTGVMVNLLDNKVCFTGMYHSIRSTSLGVGFQVSRYFIQGFYTGRTSATTGGAASSSFELHMKFHFPSRNQSLM